MAELLQNIAELPWVRVLCTYKTTWESYAKIFVTFQSVQFSNVILLVYVGACTIFK